MISKENKNSTSLKKMVLNELVKKIGIS